MSGDGSRISVFHPVDGTLLHTLQIPNKREGGEVKTRAGGAVAVQSMCVLENGNIAIADHTTVRQFSDRSILIEALWQQRKADLAHNRAAKRAQLRHEATRRLKPI